MTAVNGAFFSGGQIQVEAQDQSNQLADDFDTFLLLLTAQLQNQDPSEPLDTNDFVTQLVQFASVEQSINQTDKLEALLVQNSSDDLLQATELVGKTVEVFGNRAIISEGETIINRKFVYANSAEQNDVRITVVDEENNTVYEESGQTIPGKHQFEWNGRNNQGELVGAGTYTIKVETQATANADYEATATNIVEEVQEVLLINGELFLNLGLFSVPFSEVLATQSTVSESDQLLEASNLIGKTVEIGDNKAYVNAGQQNSQFLYKHNNSVFSTKIQVLNADGEVVYETDGSTSAGEHTFDWDGTNNDGEVVPDGTYTVSVSYQETEPPADASDDEIAASFLDLDVNTLAQVQEVFTEFGDIFVNLGSFSIPFDDVLVISETI